MKQKFYNYLENTYLLLLITRILVILKNVLANLLYLWENKIINAPK